MKKKSAPKQHAAERSPQPRSGHKAAHMWLGAELDSKREEWVYHLDQDTVAEIEEAVAGCMRADRPILDIARADFPLPAFGATLAAIRHQALWGMGVALIRGLPVQRWSAREAAIAFWGLGTYLGATVSQNALGHVLGHVKDLGLDYANADTRGYQTASHLSFHTDYSDLVALMCLRSAREGGWSMLASSSRIYAQMRAQRPDLAAVLTRPLCRSRWGEVSAEQKPWFEVPVFNLFPGGVSTSYVRSAVVKAQRLPGVPPLSKEQIEAMDMLDALAADPVFHHQMVFAPGDVQIVNNHCVLHSRTAYVDHEEETARRHLLRLWLACEDGPPFPQAMTAGFQGLSANGRPNGIQLAGVAPMAPLEAS